MVEAPDTVRLLFVNTPPCTMKCLPIVLLPALYLVIFSCNSNKPNPTATRAVPNDTTLFEQVLPTHSGVTFANAITESDTLNILKFDYLYNGGGVGIGDINNDGLPDIYFTGSMVSGRLYLNKGNFKFEDITQQAGVATSQWATGVSMIDINADGYLDIYVCTAKKNDAEQKANLLFVNNGNNTFSEKAAAYGLADTGYSVQAAFLDYDVDGDVDMYLLTNARELFPRNIPRPKKVRGQGSSTDRLYRNNGNGTFTNVSAQAGITIEGYGLGVAVSDINQDGWPDIYCANDFLTNDLLWINNGNGTFSNRIRDYLRHQSYNGMGTDIADYNNDGLTDIMVLDMLPPDNYHQKIMLGMMNYDRFMYDLQMGYEPQYMRNTLQLNNGNGTFSEIGQLAGVSSTNWSWAPLFADYDNDGFKDLFITNGFRKDITNLDFIVYNNAYREVSHGDPRMPLKKEFVPELQNIPTLKLANYFFKNNRDLTFSDRSTAWGIRETTYANGAAYADLDNDGDLDMAINNIDQAASLYRNRASQVNKLSYLKIKPKGSAANPMGLGLKLTAYTGQTRQYYEHFIHKGFQSTVDPVLHLGLGGATQVDSLEVTWPDGRYHMLKHVKANQTLEVAYANARPQRRSTVRPGKPLFEETAAAYQIDYRHQENHFIDFKIQPLLPHKYSQNGPGLAVGDANGDGLDDFYVGGASQYPGKLFFQQSNGKFRPAPLADNIPYKEDMGSLFFDADNDNDLDLYVVGGGSEYQPGALFYQDRLYRNNGKGAFRLDTTALPNTRASGSCVTGTDFDKDGDLDLFVGGRVVPGYYPLRPESYLLRNDGGKFTDVTEEVSRGLKKVGMVTSALWTDFDHDGWTDLVVVGEWMPVTFFKNQQGVLTDITRQTDLSPAIGWWNSITAGDFDNDGDIDYVAGNLGLNTKYKAAPTSPLTLISNDFDGNGSVDPILCHYQEGKLYPVHSRDALISQVNLLRKKFPRYAEYARASIGEIIPADQKSKSYVLKSDNLETSYIENLGKGKFRLRKLPIQAQFAPVFGMSSQDFNGDGNLDIVLAGNSYAAEVQAGWHDAGIGLYLEGDGHGGFTPVTPNESGFVVKGDAKGMAQIALADGLEGVLMTCNSDRLHLFTNPSKSKQATIRMMPMDAYAELKLKGGKTRRHEFYYGSTYLSQSTRTFVMPSTVETVTIVEYSGRRRTVPVM